jgi:hypothetical protein
MFHKSSQSTQVSSKRKISTKLIAGFAALSATAIITASGFAAAATPGTTPASGYGGDTSVATNINLAINHSNNNIINVVVNIFR